MTTVLVTCVGSGVGQSVVDSLVLSGGYKIVGCDMNENVYAYNYCHKFYTVPDLYSEGYLNKIIGIAEQEKVDIFIPGHDHELLIFSRHRDKFQKCGIEVLVSSPDIIEISRDKYKWYQYFSRLGCSIVPTMTVAEFRNHPKDDFFPAIVKPSGGSASQGISILKSFDELENVAEKDIIQPYLFPVKEDENYNAILRAVEQRKFVQLSEISIQLVFTKNSEVSGIFVSKNTLKAGVPVTMVPVPIDDFEYKEEIYHFIKILREKQVKGPVNLQGRITDDGFYFFEMNMRFTGITGNRAKTGFNEVAFLVHDFLELPGKLNGHAINKMGIRQVACSTKPLPCFSLNKRKTYTILGGGGYIGSFFIQELFKREDFEVINLIVRDNSFEKYRKKYESNDTIEIIKASDAHVQSIYCMTDVLINFASARANMEMSQLFQSMIFQYEQAQMLLDSYIPLVLNISSQSVYNQNMDVIKSEKQELDISSLYAFQKYMGELFFKSIHEKYPALKVFNLRFSRVIGVSSEGEASGFFKQVIDNIINSKKTIIPNPNNKINLLDIRDAVNSIFFFIDNSKNIDRHNTFNIGGTNLSLREYCNNVMQVLDVKNKSDLIEFGDTGEVKETSMIDTAIAQEYGWKQEYEVRDTILNIAKYI